MKNTLDNVITQAVGLATKKMEESSGRYTPEDRGVLEAINRYLEDYRPFDGRWEETVRNPQQTIPKLARLMLQTAKQVNQTHDAVMRLIAVDATEENRDVGKHAIDDTYYPTRTKQGKAVIAIRNVADTIAMEILSQLDVH